MRIVFRNLHVDRILSLGSDRTDLISFCTECPLTNNSTRTLNYRLVEVKIVNETCCDLEMATILN